MVIANMKSFVYCQNTPPSHTYTCTHADTNTHTRMHAHTLQYGNGGEGKKEQIGFLMVSA